MQSNPKPPTVQIKNIKHTFSPEERNAIGLSLAQSIAEKRGVEAEFDQVKASYKSKVTEKEARIDNLSTSLVNGFDMRNVSCVVIFELPAKKKSFYIEGDWEKIAKEHGLDKIFDRIEPVLVEDMTAADFQQELIEAESKFEKREEIALFNPTERDSGIIVVGMFNSKWYSAIRISIGKHKLEERLDSEQKTFRKRFDAITNAGKRAVEWLRKEMSKDAKGFEDPLMKAIALHSERVE
jgi:hypothetical protein